MKCTIMQPHFFPWSGYFNLMSKVDKFIFLDDVQYSKNSWQSRNQILINGKKKWITISTKKSALKTNINQKIIDISSNWQVKQSKTIIQNYSKCPYAKDLKELIDYFDTLKQTNLSEYNINIIKFISNKLKIKTHFINSSSFNIKKDRTFRIIKILETLNAKEYLSPEGAKEYLKNDNFEKLTNVKLLINNFKCNSYKQKGVLKFVSNLSIIDVIANLGWINAETHVKQI